MVNLMADISGKISMELLKACLIVIIKRK